MAGSRPSSRRRRDDLACDGIAIHPTIPTIAPALGGALALSACGRPTEVVTPPPTVVVTGTPGPAGPAGETGAQGKTGDAGDPGTAGKPGADTPVIVAQPSASAPGS